MGTEQFLSNAGSDWMTSAQHEKEMTRMEAANRRWFVAFMVLLFLFVATNAAWIVYESQFQDVVVENNADSDTGGTAIVLGTGIGDLYYGESEADHPDSGET